MLMFMTLLILRLSTLFRNTKITSIQQLRIKNGIQDKEEKEYEPF